MNLPYSELSSNRKLEITILLTVVIVIFKFIFPVPDAWPIILINEIIVLASVYFGMIYTSDFTALKKNTPISLVINAGILSALLFFLTAVSSSFFDQIPQLSTRINLIYSVISLLLAFIFIAAG